MKWIIYLIIILGWIVLISFYGFYSSTHPKKFISERTPADLGLEYKNITLTTKDNLKLASWYIPSENKTNKTIILLHGYPFDKGNILSLVSFLHKKFNIFMFDFRYLGRSEGRLTSVGYHEKKDLMAAVDYLKKRGDKKIGVMGFSLGGAVAIMTANETGVDAIISESSYANLYKMIQTTYRQFYFFKHPFVFLTNLFAKMILGVDARDVSPMEDIKKLDIPIMIIHGEKDSQIPVENA